MIKIEETVEFVVCVDNREYPAALESRKIYQAIPDADAAQHQMLRVIDESGEDYLYPAGLFVPIDLSGPVRQAISSAF